VSFRSWPKTKKGKTEEHEERKSQLEMRNSGGHEDDSDLHSHTKIPENNHEFFQYMNLSLSSAKGRRKPSLKGKTKNGRGEGDGGSLILFNRAITHSQFCPWIQMS